MIKRQKIRFAVVNMLILSLILLTALSGMYLMMMKLEVNTSEEIMSTLMEDYNKNSQLSSKASVEDNSIERKEEAPVSAVPQLFIDQSITAGFQAETDFSILQVEMEKNTTSNSNNWGNNGGFPYGGFPQGGFDPNWGKYYPNDPIITYPSSIPVFTPSSQHENHQSSQESQHAEPPPSVESPEPPHSEEQYVPVPVETEPPVTNPPETSAQTISTEETKTESVSTASSSKKTEKQTKATTPATTAYNGNLSRSHIFAEIGSDGSILQTSYRHFSRIEELNKDNKYDFLVQDNLRQIIQSKKRSGKVTIGPVSYRYLISKQTKSDKLSIILLDRSTESSTIKRLLFVFIIIGCAGLILVSIASVLLANWTIIPIENAWNKQKQFIADASHELKTPLTVIAANTDVVLSNPNDSVQDQERWLRYIQAETFRMSKLVNELLYIAKSDANQIKMEMTEFDISKTVSSVCLAFDSLVYESGRELVSDISPRLRYYGDEDRIKQLVTILIDNAIKYSLVHSQISLSLFRNNQNRIKLCISNKCEELSEENIAKLFDRFYRVDTSRNSKTGGNGLGLNIAQTIAEAHNGSITANYKFGMISFTITL